MSTPTQEAPAPEAPATTPTPDAQATQEPSGSMQESFTGFSILDSIETAINETNSNQTQTEVTESVQGGDITAPQETSQVTEQTEPEQVETPAKDTPPSEETVDEPESEQERLGDWEDGLETEEIGDDWTPKAANAFKRIKAQAKEYKEQLDVAQYNVKVHQKKVEEYEALMKDKSLDELQEKIQNYEEKLSKVELESTEAYEQVVLKPLGQIVERVEAIAEANGIDSNDLLAILQIEDQEKQDQAIAETFVNANDRTKAAFYNTLDKYQDVNKQKDELYSNVGEAMKKAQELDERKKLQEVTETLKKRTRATGDVVERINQKVPFIKSIEGYDPNAVLEKAASVDYDNLSVVDQQYNAVAGYTLPHLIKGYAKLQAENARLIDKLAEVDDAGEPDLNVGSQAVRPNQAGQQSSGSFLERINQQLG